MARPRTRSSGTGCARSVASPAPQLEATLLSPGEPRDVGAMEKAADHAGSAPECDHRPRIAEEPRPERERPGGRHRGDRRIAREREDEDPDARAGRAHEWRDAGEGTARGVQP